MTTLLAILSNQARAKNGGILADRVTDAFTKLLREAIALGELEEVPAKGIDGNARTIKIFPRSWIARLENAATAGVFSKLSVDEIVQRILTTEAPAP